MPAAPPSMAMNMRGAACSKRSTWRNSSSIHTATLNPKVAGTACWPWVRAAMGISAPRSASSAIAPSASCIWRRNIPCACRNTSRSPVCVMFCVVALQCTQPPWGSPTRRAQFPHQGNDGVRRAREGLVDARAIHPLESRRPRYRLDGVSGNDAQFGLCPCESHLDIEPGLPAVLQLYSARRPGSPMRLAVGRYLKTSAVVVIATTLGATQVAQAQAYPAKNLRIVISYPPGGVSDLLANSCAEAAGEHRAVGDRGQPARRQFRDRLRPRRQIAAGRLYALHGGGQRLHAESADTLEAAVQRGARLHADLDGRAADAVHGCQPQGTGQGFQRSPAIREANPGKVTFGTSGFVNQMVGEQLKVATGVNILHVPFKGSPPMLQALLAGDIDFSITTFTPYANLVKEGKLRGLAVTGRRTRAAVARHTHARRARAQGADLSPVVRALCAGRRAEAGDGQAADRDRKVPQRSRPQAAVRRGRRGRGAQHARADDG